MRYPVEGRKALAAQLALSAILAVLGGYLISCQKQESPKSEQVVQKTFASPEDAGVALYHAAKAGDHQALLGIFGPDSKKVLSSGDEVKDKDAMHTSTANPVRSRGLNHAMDITPDWIVSLSAGIREPFLADGHSHPPADPNRCPADAKCSKEIQPGISAAQ